MLLTKSGFVIDFTEYNAPAEKGAKVSRAVPPLNPKELRDLVTSAKWAGPLADLAKQPPSGPKGNPGKPKGNPGMASHGGNINKTFTSLLPKELKIIESGPRTAVTPTWWWTTATVRPASRSTSSAG